MVKTRANNLSKTTVSNNEDPSEPAETLASENNVTTPDEIEAESNNSQQLATSAVAYCVRCLRHYAIC